MNSGSKLGERAGQNHPVRFLQESSERGPSTSTAAMTKRPASAMLDDGHLGLQHMYSCHDCHATFATAGERDNHRRDAHMVNANVNVSLQDEKHISHLDLILTYH